MSQQDTAEQVTFLPFAFLYFTNYTAQASNERESNDEQGGMGTDSGIAQPDDMQKRTPSYNW